MPKRLQVVFTDEAWAAVDRVTEDACEGFEVGSISYSDVVNEMVLAARVDIKGLQLKHTDLRRSLKVLAGKEDLDLDAAIRSLMEMKAKAAKRLTKQTSHQEGSE